MGLISSIKKLFAKKSANAPAKYVDIQQQDNSHNKYFVNPNVFNLSAFGYYVSDCWKMNEVVTNDSHFASCVDTMIDKVTSLDYEISPFVPATYKDVRGKDKTVYKYITNTFDRLNVSKLISQMLKVIVTGKQVFQIKYKTNADGVVDTSSGYYEVEDLEVCNPDYFDFSYPTGDLVYIGTRLANQGVNVSKEYPYQFIVHTNNGTRINPHGESVIGKRGYILYLLKRGFIEDYAITNEIYSNPNLVATIQQYSKDGKKIIEDEEIGKLMQNINSDIFQPISKGKRAKVAKSNAIDIQYMYPDMTKMLNLQDAWEMVNREISKLILGSTKVNEGTEKTGSYSQSQTHEETTETKVERYAKQLEDTINKFIRLICDLNFDDLKGYPKFKINYRRDIVDMDEFKRIMDLMDRGLEISREWIYYKYNITAPMNDDDILAVVRKSTNQDVSSTTEESNNAAEDETEDNNEEESVNE